MNQRNFAFIRFLGARGSLGEIIARIVVCQDDVLDFLSTGYRGRAPPNDAQQEFAVLGHMGAIEKSS